MVGTVLAHIAAANPQKENLATEALAFILNRSPAARAALQRKILALVGDTPRISRVVTQTAVGDESRPDVVFLAEDGKPIGYLEAKFWAALTASQPVEYVRRITTAGGGVLVFLAPERRLPTLRGEVLERLRAAEMAPTEAGGAGGPAMAVGPVRLGLLSWSALLTSLHDAVSEDRDAASDVHQLRGLVQRFETEGFIPLTRVDLDDLEVARRLVSLTDLASEIVDVACQEGVLSVKGLKVTPRDYGGGRYAKFKSAGCWIGLDQRVWSQRGRSPIWVDFGDTDWGRAAQLRSAFRGWMNSDPPRAYSEDGELHVPLLLTVGAEKDRVIADAVRQIRELDAVVSSAGLPAL